MASRTGLRWFRLSPEDLVALPLETQAKRRSHVEDQMEWLRFGARDAPSASCGHQTYQAKQRHGRWFRDEYRVR